MDRSGQNRPVNIDHVAKTEFESALRKGFWRSVLSWIQQRDNRLVPYDEIRKTLPPSGEHYIGLRNISVDRIVGSVGRYHDFDRAFLPLHHRTQGRWVSVDKAHLTNIELPPIEVYKIGDVYFVKDGNHRVSVARERGQVFIDAVVIEIDTPIQVDKDTDVDTLIRKVEQVEFLKETSLKTLRPAVDIDLSLPGGYRILEEHIKVHRYYRGLECNCDVSWEDAVCSWVDEVYLPLVQVIRAHNILDDFPGRTETDLYLWIIEHLWYLREEYKKDVSLEEAATHFKKEYSQRPLRRFVMFVRRIARRLPFIKMGKD